ncbi:hypothetical protein CK501_08365 [Halovibrio salipaludis]|uniref:Ig-like domain-containing protein n=1 Tax=Halovibrio salipaludis TaxID=2032626 RepID=A0A2A2F6K8_9GAMM|nr:Ig-like domain-containing protein [Halovibrio salipaludis]PAU80450.1 hypothetical protein CK501_08365 [Halovibrio salipaludis]
MTLSPRDKLLSISSTRKASRTIAALVVFLLMSACGGGDDSGTTQTASEHQSQSSETDGESATETDTQDEVSARKQQDPETPHPPAVQGVMTDSGMVPSGVIKDGTIGFTGQATAGHSVELYMNDLFIGSALTSGDGEWTFDYQSVPIETGQHQVTLASVGSDGLRMESESEFEFTYLPAAVEAPEILAISPDTGASADDGITRSGELTVSGTATPTVPVEVFINDSRIGTVEADDNGNWALDYSDNALGDGIYDFHAKTLLEDDSSATSVIYPVIVDSSIASPTMQLVNDTGTQPDDGTTNDPSVTLSGNTEPDTTIDIYRDGTLEGTVTADANGDWVFDGGGRTLPEGNYSYTAGVTDLAGNTAESDAPLNVTVDTTPPSVSTNLELSPDTGTDGDWLTNSGELTFSGETEANAQVELFIDGNSIGTTLADGSGQWQQDHSNTPLGEGTYQLTHEVMDPAGNPSGLSGGQSFTIDQQAPAEPVVSGIEMDTGLSASDRITADNTLEFTGTSDANVAIEVFMDGSSIGTTTADGSGIWRFDYTGTDLRDGDYNITAQAEDDAGNTSSVSPGLTIIVDTTTPEPTVTGITDDTGTVGNDGITNDTTLIFDGTSEANASVEVFIDGTSIGTTTANGSGNWSFDHTGTPLADGDYTVTAQATDTAGNTSSVSAAQTVTIDTTIADPTVDSITEDTATDGDQITSDDTLIFNGTSEANASVELFIDGTSIGTTTADGSGNWSFDHTGTALPDGDHTVTAQATDNAGNTSSVSAGLVITVDTAIAAPTVTGITDDTGSDGNDGITSDNTLTFNGTSKADASVEVFIDGTSIGTTTADGSGNWSFSHTSLSDGDYTVTAEATDTAGNTSDPSGDFNLTVDTSTPAAPAVTGITDDTGSDGNDGITSDDTLTFNGTSEANISIEVFIDGTPIGTTTADGSGNWSLDHTSTTLADANYTVTAQAIDTAGNTSALSGDFNLTVDTSTPVTPAVTGITEDRGPDGSDGITSDNTLVFTGTSEADTSIEVFLGGSTIGTTTADSSGNWSLDHTGTNLAEGDHTVTAEATNTAGNSSGVSGGFTITVDTTAPSADSLVPANGATGVTLGQNLVFNASETVHVESGDVIIRELADDSVFESIPVGDARVTGDGTTTLTVDPASDLVGGTQYYVEISTNAFQDLAGNGFAGYPDNSHWSFTTEDFVLTGTTPADEDTGVALDTPLTFVFNEPGFTDAGNIEVRRGSDDSLFETIDVATASLTGDGTNTLEASLADTLEPNTSYYIETDAGAFVNANGAAFGGITGSTELNFSTADVPTPTVTNVTSSATDGTYRGGDTIPLQVTFSETVNVTGTPRLQVDLDGTDKNVSYTSGSGTDTLQFDYDVRTGDSTPELAYTSTSALERNGGSIRSVNQANADLTLPGPGNAGSLSDNKNLEIIAADLDMSNFTEDDGFRVQGYEADDYFGRSLGSGGDINGDGYEDFVVGVSGSDMDATDAGAAYVIFGRPGATRADLLADGLAGEDGFLIRGAAGGDHLGMPVDLSGDLNGDGYDDAVVIASSSDDSVSNGGMVYVIWGQSGSTRADVDVSALAASDGFRILPHESGDLLGNAMNIDPQNAQFLDTDGDFNGDGIDDLVIGHSGSDNDGTNSGQAYVIFGQTGSTRSDVDLSAIGGNGFRVTTGGTGGDYMGHSVQFMGDFNGDGLNDLTIGAPRSGGTGEVYVVFGHEGPTYSDVNLAAMSDTEGFAVTTTESTSWLGGSVGSSDINGDGLTDLLIGNVAADESAGDSGSAVAVYGHAAANYPDLSVDSIPTGSGFTIAGEGVSNFASHAVEGAGDVNGDGIDDILISTWVDDEGGTDAGAAWLIYGRTGTSRSDIQLNTLTSSDGFKIIGAQATDYFGRTNAAGDLNGDGFQDMIVSSPLGDQNGTNTGETNVIWGKDFLSVVDTDLNGTSGADTLVGTSNGETLTGGGGADRITAGAGDDIIQVANLDFLRVDGSRGTDVLELTGSSLSLDLRTLAYDMTRGLEVIDLGGLGNSLTVSKSSLLALSDEVRTLYVRGDGSDWVVTDSGESWTANGTVTRDTITYNRYDLDEVSLFVEQSLSQPEAPAAPSVDDFSEDTGTTGDGLTSDTGLMFSGTTGAYFDVEVFQDDASVGTTTADGAGNWTFDHSGTTLADGSYNFTAQATNLGGYTSAVSTALSVTVDASIATPSVTGITTDTGVSGDGITSDPTLVIHGTSDPEDAVEVFLEGSSIGTTTADGSGNWSFDYTGTTLGDGNYTITAQATDDAGNTSNESPAFAVTVDTGIADPAVTGITSDTGASANDGITNDNTLIFEGTSEASTSVDILLDGSTIGTTTADDSGNWSFDYTGTTLGDGNYTITAQATDDAGNTSNESAAFTVTVDTSIADPTVTSITEDTGTDGDQITGDTTLFFDGTSEANASVEVFIDSTSIGTTTAGGSGNWSFNHTGTNLAEGDYTITARATDDAGNTSNLSSALAITIDATAPTVSSLTPANDATDIALGSNLEMVFSEDVIAQSGDITILRSADDSVFEEFPVTDGNVSGSGTDTITITPSSDLEIGTGYYVNLDNGALADAVGNAYSGINNSTAWSFSTETPLLLDNATPTDDATGVMLNTDLSLTFNLNVVAETGDIRLYRSSDDSLFETVAATSGQVSGKGTDTITVSFSDTLEPDTDYYVEIDGNAFSDGNGEFYEGISDPTSLNFRTTNASTPEVTDVSSSTADGTYASGDEIAITVTFSEAVNVTGFPQVQIGLDDRSKTINYTAGSGTDTLTFAYEVTPGDTRNDLGYVDTDSLRRNGGAIRSTDFANADLNLPAPGAAGSLSDNKSLVVDAPYLDITGLSLANGFFVRGWDSNAEFGQSISGGADINGDGYEDFIVGLTDDDQFDTDAGAAYVIFGKPGETRSDIELQTVQSTVESSNGFAIFGEDSNNRLGSASTLTGDLNGDGYDDIVVAAGQNDSGATHSGTVYVIWGQSGATRSDINVSNIDSNDGFRITGYEHNNHLGDSEETDLENDQPFNFLDASGDFNGDGINDLLIGHSLSDHSGTESGVVYLVFGQSGDTRLDVDLGNLGSDGFKLTNNTDHNFLGNSVQFIGDYNADGYNDIFLGEVGSDTEVSHAGRAYVVFGHGGSTFNDVDVTGLDGNDGFAITTSVSDSRLGSRVHGGDVNGDGRTDLVVGQSWASPNGRTEAGRTAVIYGAGSAPYPDIDVDSLSSPQGFVIQGETAGDFFGHNACVGDMDADGIDDLLVTGWEDAQGGTTAGAAWVIYGEEGTSRTMIDLASLSGAEGFKIIGDKDHDEFGKNCALADINGNGYQDLILTSEEGEDNGTDTGEVNVIWGRDFQAKSYGGLTGNNAVNHIVGTDGDDNIATLEGADTVASGAGADAISISDLNFRRIDAGRQTDALVLDMSSTTLNLTNFGYHQFRDVEVIDLSNKGNTLAVTAREVLAITRESSELFVWGGANDTVTDADSGGWTNNGSTTIGGVNYIEYTRDGATLFVEDTITNGGL